MSDVNGTDPAVAAALSGQVPLNQVNPELVQALSEALDRARRGDIQAMALVGVRGSDLASIDMIVVNVMAHAMIMMGSLEVVKAKLVQGALAAQQQVQRGSGRIIRPGPVG
jgi:hypothetical protein